MTDDQFISRVAARQQFRRRWGRSVGIGIVAIGAATSTLSTIKVVNDTNRNIQFLRDLSKDLRPLEKDRVQATARIAYGYGVMAGVGLGAAVLSGSFMIFHGLVVLFSSFQGDRLLLEAYHGTDGDAAICEPQPPA